MDAYPLGIKGGGVEKMEAKFLEPFLVKGPNGELVKLITSYEGIKGVRYQTVYLDCADGFFALIRMAIKKGTYQLL